MMSFIIFGKFPKKTVNRSIHLEKKNDPYSFLYNQPFKCLIINNEIHFYTYFKCTNGSMKLQ